MEIFHCTSKHCLFGSTYWSRWVWYLSSSLSLLSFPSYWYCISDGYFDLTPDRRRKQIMSANKDEHRNQQLTGLALTFSSHCLCHHRRKAGIGCCQYLASLASSLTHRHRHYRDLDLIRRHLTIFLKFCGQFAAFDHPHFVNWNSRRSEELQVCGIGIGLRCYWSQEESRAVKRSSITHLPRLIFVSYHNSKSR